MLLKPASAVALLALASQAVAEPRPYKPVKVMMSAREIFGLDRRQTGDGYQPTQTFCGMGDTCAEACGAGFATCPSKDNAIHCYNPQANQACCPDGTGNSCDAGFYCTGTTTGDTVCCPEGQSLADCAKAYAVTGSLTSEIALPTSSSTSSTSSSSSSSTSSSAISTSSTWSSVSSSSPSAYSSLPPVSSSAPYSIPANSTYTVLSTGYSTSSCTTSTLAAAPTFPAANTTTTKAAAATTPASTTPSTVPVSGATVAGPAAAVVLAAAAAFAALW